MLSDLLSLRTQTPAPPPELRDVFDPDRYRRSQAYMRARTRFGAHSGALRIGIRPEAFHAGGNGEEGLEAVIDPSTREILGSETLVRGTIEREPVTIRLPGVVRDVPPRLIARFADVHCFADDDAGVRLDTD